MMHHHRRADAAWREAKWLPRLVCRCRDLPDILKFVRVAARSLAPATCLYEPGRASTEGPAGPDDVGIDMGLVSVDQAMLEAEFAAEVCADLSLACAIDVSQEDGIAWAGPGAIVETLIQACRDQQMEPCLTAAVSSDGPPESVLSALLRDPAPLVRVQTVGPCGHVQWLPLRGRPETLEQLCTGAPSAGIISRLELRLRPAACQRNSVFDPTFGKEGSLRWRN